MVKSSTLCKKNKNVVEHDHDMSTSLFLVLITNRNMEQKKPTYRQKAY